MLTVRKSVFETNSSSCHCLTLLKKEEMEMMFHDQHSYVIHCPDTGEYQTGDKYEILKVEDAIKLWNSHVDEYNERYKDFGSDFHVDPFDESRPWDFLKAIQENTLSTDELFGCFMDYGQMMRHIPPMSNELDVIWWNYN